MAPGRAGAGAGPGRPAMVPHHVRDRHPHRGRPGEDRPAGHLRRKTVVSVQPRAGKKPAPEGLPGGGPGGQAERRGGAAVPLAAPKSMDLHGHGGLGPGDHLRQDPVEPAGMERAERDPAPEGGPGLPDGETVLWRAGPVQEHRPDQLCAGVPAPGWAGDLGDAVLGLGTPGGPAGAGAPGRRTLRGLDTGAVCDGVSGRYCGLHHGGGHHPAGGGGL